MAFDTQIKNIIENFFTNTAKTGVTITRTPITKTISGTYGDQILTEGTVESIVCYISRNFPNEFFISDEGEVEKGDAFILVKAAQTLNKKDKITYDSNDYEVRNIYRVMVNNTLCGIQGNLFLI